MTTRSRLADLGDLAGLGVHVVRQMAREGRLGPRALSAAARCGWEAFEEWKAGDRASEPVAASKTDRCSRCPIQTSEPMVGVEGTRHYCGVRCDLRPDVCDPAMALQPDPGCGCLTGITVDGVRIPAGKARLASFVCPAGYFDEMGRNPRP